MGRRMHLAAACALTLAACTASVDSPTTERPTPTTSTTETPRPGSAVSGRLATIDDSGDIVVISPDGSGSQTVTEDAGQDAFFTQPIWSPDASSLAWGQGTASGFAVGIGGVDAQSGTTLITTSNLPFYTYWSPDGAYLGVLHNGSQGVAFQMIDVARGTNRNLDEDTPFYFSWSPVGDRVVTHAGESRAETITPEGEHTSLEPTAATYLAPQWTESGVFHVVGDHLVLEDAQGRRTPVASVGGFTMFVANRQGSSVALQTTGDGSAITAAAGAAGEVIADTVMVVDVVSGDIEIVDGDLALGFFWSPDGESVLVLTVEQSRVVPLVWSSDGDESTFAAYRPQPSMLEDFFPFFPQYAQSVGFWAPDSSAFAYAGTVSGQSGIWVQSLTESDPRRVAAGSWVAWSPGGP